MPICAAIVTQFVTHIWRDLSTPSESLWKALGESDAEAACWVHGLTASVSEQNLFLGNAGECGVWNVCSVAHVCRCPGFVGRQFGRDEQVHLSAWL